MNLSFSAFFFGLLLAYCLGQSNVFPAPPRYYSVFIEANLLESNTTVSLLEYTDQDANSTRLEIYTVSATTIQVVAQTGPGVNIGYRTSDGATCQTVNPVTPAFLVLPGGARSLLQLWAPPSANSGSLNMTYANTTMVRGMLCDTFLANIYWQDPAIIYSGVSLPGTTHTLNFTYFFSVPSWGFPPLYPRKPVAIYLNATDVYTNLTSRSISHQYHFVGFLPRRPVAGFPLVFSPPDNCVNVVQQTVSLIKTKSGAGLAVGMFFLGLIFGAIFLGFSLLCCPCGKKKKLNVPQFMQQHVPQVDEHSDDLPVMKEI